MVLGLGPGFEEAAGAVGESGGGGGQHWFQFLLLCFAATNSGEQLGAPFNLGQTDGDSVCGDCINIFNLDEGCAPFISFFFFHFFQGVVMGWRGVAQEMLGEHGREKKAGRGKKKMVWAR